MYGQMNMNALERGQMNMNALERAVSKRDLETVRFLLRAGTDANLPVGQDRATVLHVTDNVEIAKELLLYGARVDETNKYRETPLHHAISHNRELAFIRELLKHGADVNSTNRKNNTPLNQAVKKQTPKLEIVKELLEYGADINIRNRERSPYEDCHTPLDNAMNKSECAKLLIKFTLLRDLGNNTRAIDLAPYDKFPAYPEILRYQDDCIQEIFRMKIDKINDNLSLYELMTMKSRNTKPPLLISDKVRYESISNRYPIYDDIISVKIKKEILKRTILLSTVSELQLYVKLDTLDQDVEGKRVVLNCYCASEVAKYLSNDDLLNLITAFSKHARESFDSSGNFVELCQQTDTKQDEIFESSGAKRARLELPLPDFK